MIIDAKYKPWLACADDFSRPALQFVNIEPTGAADENGLTPAIAVAADGFILAVTPCQLEPGDIPGLIHQEAWRLAVRLKPPKKRNQDPRLNVALDPDLLRLPNGITLPRQQTSFIGKFINWRVVVDSYLQGAREPAHGNARGIYAQLLTRLCAALGSPLVKLVQFKTNSPILIEPVDASYPEPPYGLLMPMHIDGRSLTRWHEYQPPAAAPHAGESLSSDSPGLEHGAPADPEHRQGAAS